MVEYIKHPAKYFFWDFSRIYIATIYSTKYCKSKFKIGQKNCFVCFNENPQKMLNSAFYFLLKVLFILKRLKFLSWLSGHLEETAWLKRSG